jgi:predicted dienelactone hydrolase
LENSILDTIPQDQIHPEMTKEKMKEIDFSPVRESYQDSRISAVFLMAPALVDLFDPVSLESIQVPLYIVAPEQDLVVPAEKNGKVLARLVRKAALNIIPGAASHYVFLNEVSKGGKMMLDKRIAVDPPTVDRKQIHADIGLQAVQFFSEHLSF